MAHMSLHYDNGPKILHLEGATLHGVARFGHTTSSLLDLDTLQLDVPHEKTIPPRDAGREFYALIGLDRNQPYDITATKSLDGSDTSFVVKGFSEEGATRLLDTLCGHFAFFPADPPPELFASLANEFRGPDMVSYNAAEVAARLSGLPLPHYMGSFWYANFLIRYRGMDEVEAMTQATTHFQVPFEG